MDRMTSLRVFREVVEAGSFVAAAGRLGMSPPMASKPSGSARCTGGNRSSLFSTNSDIRIFTIILADTV